MKPGKVDLLTKEIVALAVSITNSCRYCINSHTAAAQKLGMTPEQHGEVLAVVGLYNQMNKLVGRLAGRAGHPSQNRLELTWDGSPGPCVRTALESRPTCEKILQNPSGVPGRVFV